ncbi:MAG TPA: DUF2911 domain-containing protein [Saprospiraceae bacterium]|nr:DUF2911 domain-containing protein [Saprospiraceae bacterium]
MKTFFSFFCLCMAVFFTSLQAQMTTPAPSPFSKLEQKVGLTDVTIEYSRPSAKGRVVFGQLVPFGEVWRAGANSVTKVTFSNDVKIGGTDLKTGSYALLITPNKESWQIHFFPYDKSNWTSYVGESAPAAAAVMTAKTMALPFSVETWTMGIGNLSNNGAQLNFIWESTYAGVEFTVPTETAVMASIEKTMAGPGASDYSAAATYYLSEGKDLNQALAWINTSLEKGGDRYWLLRTKALIQAGLGDKAGAIETAKKSTQLAQEAGNNEYVRMNTNSIGEWMQ